MDESLGLSKFPEFVSSLGRLSKVYHQGYELGNSGREPPMDFNQVTRIRRKKREEDPLLFFERKEKKELIFENFKKSSLTDILLGKEAHREPEVEFDSTKLSFRKGYIDGLNQFMQSNGIDFTSTGLFRGTEVISTDDGLVGFVRGARLEEPSIPRDYNPPRSESKKFLINEPEPDFVAEMRFKNALTQAGYKFGFIVGIARDYGVVLKGDVLKCDVPMDDDAYRAFMQGLKGNERDLPYEFGKLYSRSEANRSLIAKLQASWEVDNQAYHSGLQVWLKSQGIEGVDTWRIRHPEALRAFKTALQGERLTEYEPKPTKDWLNENYKKTSLKEDYFILKNKFEKNSFRIEPTPEETARQLGQEGYNLGRAIRLMRR